ncbi:TPA: hypothetical protein QEF70_002730 [Stenotrophomonas maltophilia]|nr:hypothetical protein [Stenotrophomonas maltophilia]
MSNDNTVPAAMADQADLMLGKRTLADVQPGGRVRLGDQAERAQWRSMDTCPRDGTVVRLRWGEDHVSPGWWSAPVSPVQNDDGTWPSDTGGFPWAFIDFNNGSAFVNHAVDTEYGPTHWAPYAALSAQPSPGGQGELAALVSKWRNEASAYDDQQAKETGFEVDWTYDAKARALDRAADELESALAARQPVGQIVGYMDPNADFMLARPGDCVLMGNIVLWREPGSKYTKPLYDAPPAQAVDLSTLERFECQLYENPWPYSKMDEVDGGDWVRFDDVKALIDSQAVGK